MARGWESKSVEAQQEDAAAGSTPEKSLLTKEEAAQLREKENLRLSLQSVLEQLGRNHEARRRAMLELAKSDLEQRIENLSASRSDHRTS